MLIGMEPLVPVPDRAHEGHRRLLRVVGFLGGGVVAFGVLCILAKTTPFFEWGNTMMMPAELRTALFVSALPGHPSVSYTLRGFTYVPRPFAGTKEVASISSSRERVAVLIDRDTGRYEVQQQGATLVTSQVPLFGAAVSPDGDRVAYAAEVTRSGGSTYWQVMLRTPGAASSTPLSYGFSPFFIDDTHILHFTGTGLRVIDLASGKSTEVFKTIFPPFPSETEQSPDRTLVAWRDARGHILVYRVTATSATHVDTIDLQDAYALGNDALYEVRDGAVWRHPLSSSEEARHIFRLPADLLISDLVL
jgi:hypothetical protein